MSITIPTATASTHTARRMRARRWPLPRWRDRFRWDHLIYRPSPNDLRYLDAYRRLLRARQRPTLERLGRELGVMRQTVWQMEQKPLFFEWLATEIRLWRQGFGWTDGDGNLRNGSE